MTKVLQGRTHFLGYCFWWMQGICTAVNCFCNLKFCVLLKWDGSIDFLMFCLLLNCVAEMHVFDLKPMTDPLHLVRFRRSLFFIGLLHRCILLP